MNILIISFSDTCCFIIKIFWNTNKKKKLVLGKFLLKTELIAYDKDNLV